VGNASAALRTRDRDLATEYFARLSGQFDQAAAALGGAHEDELGIGGLRLRLRWAGEPIRRALLPPFEHLLVDPGGGAELEIAVFDTASSGVEPPVPTWSVPPVAPGTNPVARLRSERAGVLAASGTRALTAVEPRAGRAVYHVPDAGAIAASERAAPLREALQLLMAEHGRLLTHAGAVGRRGRGVLLVGRGGSGKSTLALACALAGMQIAADDYVLLDPDPPLAHAMQSTAKLTEDSAARLAIPAEAIDPAGFEPTLEGPAKALVDLRTLAPGSMAPQLELRAIVAPTLAPSAQPPPPPPLTSCFLSLCERKHEVSGGGGGYGGALRRISAAEGLRAVGPSTIVQLGFAGGPALAALADLVRRLPSYALALSPDPATNAAAVDRLVAELG
jgi:hypothetical protein